MKDNQLHKIHFRSGDIELHLEGEFKEIVKEFRTFIEELIPKLQPMMSPETTRGGTSIVSKPPTESMIASDLHLSTLISKIEASSMADEVLITCYYLYQYKGAPRFTRKTILEETKESGRYTKNLGNNLTAVLRRLVKKGYLAMFSNKEYAITASKGVERARTLLGESPGQKSK